METPSEKPSETPAETQPPQQPDKPTTVPTPEDPREHTPMRDPPARPDHDRTRIAGKPGERTGNDEETVRGYSADDDDASDLEANTPRGAVRPDNPSPDSTVFDENQAGR